MIDLRQQDIILLGPSPEIPNNDCYYKMRRVVYEKLAEAARRLEPMGLRFCLYEAYRSVALQETLFNNRYQLIKKNHPAMTHEEIYHETVKLVSPILNLDGSRNVPPHSTGGAIDVYLVDKKGKPVPMGIHPADWMKDIDGSLSLTAARCISPEAQSYRLIMSGALASVGFINYATEYWHWEFGTRYWARHTNHPYALYGTI